MIPRSRSGSTILVALLLIAVVGVITAGGVAVLTARSAMVEQMAVAAKRRIALENSKALAQEFMLERVMASTAGSAFSYALDDDWGGISVPAWGSAPLLSVQKAAGVNPFNPGNGDGYTLDLIVAVSDGTSSFDRKFQIKSRSPLFAGTLLSSQKPTITTAASIAVGAIDVNGAAFVWQPSLSMAFTPDSYSMPDSAGDVTFTNSSGGALLMSNVALPRQIADPRAGGAPFYNGEFDAIDNASSAANSSVAKVTAGSYILVDGSADADATDGVTCDGAGNVTITLDTPELTNVYIPGNVATLTLVGQSGVNDNAASGLPAILVVLDQPAASARDLASVDLTLHNSRRLDLAMRKESSAGNLPVQFEAASAQWRLVLEAENTPIAIDATGIVALQGGIRSDRSILLSSGSLQLNLDDDPKLLERYATRTAWVESYAQ